MFHKLHSDNPEYSFFKFYTLKEYQGKLYWVCYPSQTSERILPLYNYELQKCQIFPLKASLDPFVKE